MSFHISHLLKFIHSARSDRRKQGGETPAETSPRIGREISSHESQGGNRQKHRPKKPEKISTESRKTACQGGNRQKQAETNNIVSHQSLAEIYPQRAARPAETGGNNPTARVLFPEFWRASM